MSSFLEMSEEECEMYLDVLKEGILPFDRYVSRGDIPDIVDIKGPRKRTKIDEKIGRTIHSTQVDHAARFLPLVGAFGTGKTHLYWVLKRQEIDYFKVTKKESDRAVVYVPSPPAPVRILFHIYTSLCDEFGIEAFERVADELIKKAERKGLKSRIFGMDPRQAIGELLTDYPGTFADCVKVLIILAKSKARKSLAKRWLFGESLTEEDLKVLEVSSIIEEDDVCLSMIKLVAEHLGKNILLFFDEFEIPMRMHGPEAEARFWETLKRIFNEVKNIVIISACLDEVWERVKAAADAPMRSRLEPELFLPPFTLQEVYEYFKEAMKTFWDENNLNPPSDPFFPLNEEILRIIYEKTNGNPRNTLKLCRIFIDEIISGEVKIEEIMPKIEVPLEKAVVERPVEVAAERPLHVPTSEIIEKVEEAEGAEIKPEIEIKEPPTPPTAEVSLEPPHVRAVEAIIEENEYLIEITPSAVVGVAVQVIENVSSQTGEAVEVSLDHAFKVGSSDKKLGALIRKGDLKVCIDVPSIKSFDKSGGVAAFYSAKRISDAINEGIASKGILIVPKETKGAKYQSLIEELGERITVVEIDRKDAENLIKTVKTTINDKALEIAKTLFPNFTPPSET